MAYQPKLKKMAKVMKKQGHLLHKDEPVKRLLTPPLKISYRSAKKIKLQSLAKDAKTNLRNQVKWDYHGKFNTRFFIGQCFFRLHQIYTFIKNKFFCLLLSYFWIFNPYSHEWAKASPLTPSSIFKSIEGRDIPKSRDLYFAW